MKAKSTQYRDGKRRREPRPTTGTGRLTPHRFWTAGTDGDIERMVRPHGTIVSVVRTGPGWVSMKPEDYPPPRRRRARKLPVIRPIAPMGAWVTILATEEGWRELYPRLYAVGPQPDLRPRLRGPGVLWRVEHVDLPDDPLVCRALDELAAKLEACRCWHIEPHRLRYHEQPEATELAAMTATMVQNDG